MAGAPAIRAFKPCGVPRSELLEVYLPLEGLEAMRLIDLEGLDQAEAAARMGVSRQTLGRILAGARRTATRALVEGLALSIETAGSHIVSGDAGPAQQEGPLRLAVSVTGSTLDDRVDPRFGRAFGFLIVDPETMDMTFLANQTASAGQGAGIGATEAIAAAGARVLLTGIVGPKAFRALALAGIKVCQNQEGISAREAVQRWVRGEVAASSAPAMGPGQ